MNFDEISYAPTAQELGMAFVICDHRTGYHRLVEKVRDAATGPRRNRTVACLGRYPTVQAAATGLTNDLRTAEAELAMLRKSKTAYLWEERRWILRLEDTVEKLREQLQQVQRFVGQTDVSGHD